MNMLSSLLPFRTKTWDPFREFESLQQRLAKLFERTSLNGAVRLPKDAKLKARALKLNMT